MPMPIPSQIFTERSRSLLGCAVAFALVSGAAAIVAAQAPRKTPSPAVVRVWEDTMVLPTYEEGLPDVNAPFDIFTGPRFNYPYTLRTSLTTTRTPRRWRTLNLENEYLRCTVLPDLGGHLYTCVDKMNGQDLFYANSAIKFANVAYRGAWAALGIEFNFPVSHNWMTVSPVDYAIVSHPDGSGSIWIGNIDRVYGGQWRVELTLRPRRAVLEQHTSLYNRSARRHRFYWWTNAAVRVQDDSRILHPTKYTAAHGFAAVDTWPVDAHGVDNSVVRNHTTGPVSLFSHGSHEPYIGVYHPSTRSGVVHYSSPINLPAKKFWSWGSDPDGLDWRVALSDDKSAYVEVQAGLFRNQETYEFLEPQETIAFDEYWLPLREIDGLARASSDAALNLTRTPEDAEHVALDAAFTVTRPVVNGHVRVSDGTRVVAEEPLSTDPSRVVRRTFHHLPAATRYTFDVRDSGGTLVSHTEDTYDFVPSSEITTGPQRLPQLPPASAQSEAQVVEAGRLAELDGKLLDAYAAYERGLERTPDSFALSKAAGRLAVHLERPDEALAHFTRAEARVSNDPEVEYYLGEAYLLNDDIPHATPHLILAQQRSAFRAAARFELARLDARAGHLAEAARLLAEIGAEFPDAVRPGQAHVAVLRHLQRADEARRTLEKWRRVDPTSNGLRYESVLLGLGGRDAALWAHLASDPDRLLEMSTDYFGLSFFDDAATLLARRLPHGDGVISEPGTPAAEVNPLIAYYRGYARQRSGQSPDADFDAARGMPTTYIFPNRWETGRVLEAALARRADDATARFLLGSWYLSGGRVQPALEAWMAARKLNARLPGLHRNLGLTLLLALDKPDEAVDAFREGLDADPHNIGVYVGIDQAMSLTGHSAEERAAALARYPNADAMPAMLSFKLALALAEAGKFADAERVFVNRFFAREEGGTNVRQVYLEVQLLHARAAAAAGEGEGGCGEALGILDGMRSPVEGLAFTRDGLAPFLDGGRLRYERGVIEARCGRRDAARTDWQSVLKSGATFPFVDITYAYRSAQRLCDGVNEARSEADCRAAVSREWQPRLEEALAAAARRADLLGTSVPGAIRNAQGLLLASLGRGDEARQRFREALRANDTMLSHHLAREGLQAVAAAAR
jgi:tetratricopeptide (TPR) repeat protein